MMIQELNQMIHRYIEMMMDMMKGLMMMLWGDDIDIGLRLDWWGWSWDWSWDRYWDWWYWWDRGDRDWDWDATLKIWWDDDMMIWWYDIDNQSMLYWLTEVT